MGLTVAKEVKQPREIIQKGYDFTGDDRLQEGDSIVLVGSSAEVFDAARQDVSTEMIVADSLDVVGNFIFVMLKEGEPGEHKLTFLAATAFGELLEEDYVFSVEEL